MKLSHYLLVVCLAFQACGPGETELIVDGGGHADSTADVGDEPEPILPDTTAPEETMEETAIDIPAAESGSEIPLLQCDPGEGCFMDKCSENSQCQSGWCVEHMGESVCTQACSEECPSGWTCKQVGASDPDLIYVCVSLHSNLCKPCQTTEGCKAPGGAEDVCVDYGDEGSFCGGVCETAEDCPWGFLCLDVMTIDAIETRQCVAEAGVCPCTDNSITLSLWTPCEVKNEHGACQGMRVCAEEGLTPCDAAAPAEEQCNGNDDDCDGDVDEPVEDEGDYINLCDDDNDCTDDNCKGEGGCEYVELNEGECLDGDPCTVADHCEAGVCVGNPVACDDSNPCTDDSCDGAGGCMFENNSAACDDDDPCTVADQCADGKCGGQEIPCDCQTDADCAQLEDDDLCNGTLVCDLENWPFKCAVAPGTEVICPAPAEGPDSICLHATCDPTTGQCSEVADHEGFACEDGDACTIGDKCSEGVCTSGVPLGCADNNPCTDDTCDPLSGCVFPTNTLSCDDGDVCTIDDQCNNGECNGGGALVCDDGNVCNGAETCDPDTGCKPGETLVCDNGNACDGFETCHPVNGCQAGLDAVCNDGNVCTDDTCDAEGGCVHTPNAAGCDDANACTEGDHCDSGACVYSELKVCADENICTDEWCDPLDGCVTNLNEAPCDDQDVCTTGDHCHLGECISAGELTCNDGNDCTDDLCLAGIGCQFSHNVLACDDGNECTTGDQCTDGWCLPAQVLDCDDGNLCTDDSCDGEAGCEFSPNSAPCDDDDECTENDECSAGLCVVSDNVDCNDGNECTEDGCVPATGCDSQPVVDGSQCGSLPGERCVGGNCVCVQLCDGKECGPDGCGGSCGNCTGPQEACMDGVCECQPVCVGKECGSDGCGGECGPCQPGFVCQLNSCIESSCGEGEAFGGGCLWKVGSDLFLVPSGVNSVNVTIIGGGAGGGSGFYYPGGGGGSGYYKIEEAFPVTPGQNLLVQVGSGGGMEEEGTASKFGSLTVQGGLPGKPHTGNSGQSSAKGGNGGSGGGAGYTNTSNGGGIGSGISMGQYAGAPGTPSPGSNQAAKRGQGFGAGGGGDPGTSGYNSSCGGLGGSNGSNGVTVGGCGGGGGGAGGLIIPGYGNPGSTGTTAGASGIVFITM